MIQISGLCKHFRSPTGERIEVLHGIDLDVPASTITAVVGPSGSGKTTLSKCISLLEQPSSGSVLVNGKNLSTLTGAALRHERRAIGTIFQASALLRRRTAAQNIALPLEYLGVVQEDIDARVAELLDQVGLSNKAHAYPDQLSGGQRQRIGIARALALHPQVLLADEATSGLDPEATDATLSLLMTLRDRLGLSIILITHEMDVVRRAADRVAVLRAGRIVERGTVSALIAEPASSIGQQLLPIKPGVLDLDGLTFDVAYGADKHVPADWISRLSDVLGARVHLLGGTVEASDSRQAGRLRIGLTFPTSQTPSAERAAHYLSSLGLVPTLLHVQSGPAIAEETIARAA